MMHRTLMVVCAMMTHRTMRWKLLLVLLMHLHVSKSLVVLRPIHHVILILVCMLEHVGALRRDRSQGSGGRGRRVRCVRSSSVSRRVRSARALRVEEEVWPGLREAQRTISHQLGVVAAP